MHKISHSAGEGWIRPVRESGSRNSLQPINRKQRERWLKQPWTLRRNVPQRAWTHTILKKTAYTKYCYEGFAGHSASIEPYLELPLHNVPCPPTSRPFKPYTFSKLLTLILNTVRRLCQQIRRSPIAKRRFPMKRKTVFSPNTFIESYFKENRPVSVHKGSSSDLISSQFNLYSKKSSNFTRSASWYIPLRTTQSVY
jgi:hypothetical protein